MNGEKVPILTYMSNPERTLFCTKRHGNTDSLTVWERSVHHAQPKKVIHERPEIIRVVTTNAELQEYCEFASSKAATRKTFEIKSVTVPKKSILFICVLENFLRSVRGRCIDVD